MRLSRPSFSIITESCLDDSVCRQSGDPGFWSVDLHTGPRGPGVEEPPDPPWPHALDGTLGACM